MSRLAGKTALITGAARGIGRTFAESYIAEGARVAIADINLAAAQATAGVCGAVASEMDVARQDSIEAGVAEAITELGQIDILINNAAIFTAAPLVEITPEDYSRVFDINVQGTLFTMQAVARHMIAAGIRGKIINMASQAGRRGEALVAVYCASKAAVLSLPHSAGLHLIANGINVNAIAPGLIKTDFARALWENPETLKRATSTTPLRRIGEPVEIAGAAVYMASDAGSFMTGQMMVVDGGQTVV